MTDYLQSELTVLKDRYVPSPESDSADEGLPTDAVTSVPLGFAVDVDWPTDAHCTQYECVTIDGISVRLASGALSEGVAVRMAWLIGDVDAPDHIATPEWRDETEPKLEASGLAWYSTTGGYRVIAALDQPEVLRTPADGERWKARYHAWCDELQADHGLELDTQACDWTRLFRLPRVVRDGAPTSAELHGTPPAVALPPPSKVAPAARAAASEGNAADRAIAMAERLPPAVSGHGGDRALFTAAGELATILESADDVHAVLAEAYNPRCLPPWPDSKLRREARAAVERVAALGGVGKWAKRLTDEREADIAEPADLDGLPLQCDHKGRPLPILQNVAIALDAWFSADLWLDEMGGRIRCERAADLLQCPDGVWGDRHTTALHGLLQAAGIRVSRPDTRNAIDLHASRHGRNPLGEALAALAAQWDGASRVDAALPRYWGCDDTPAVRASSRVTLLSIAARGMAPGTKVDTCLVLVGQQGAGKSTSLRALALRDEWFGDSDLPLGDKDARQLIRGKWIWEMQELAGLHKREVEQVKAFISQTYDTFRAAYKESVEDVPRTCVLFGTANRVDILQDPTGNRRFLPVVVGEIDIDAIQHDRDQLLAEAAARVLAGEQHWPTNAEKSILADAAKHFEESDPWEDAITRWLTSRADRVSVGFTTAEVLSFSGGAIPLDEARQGPREARRLAGILHRLGFSRRRIRRHGRREYCWLPQGADASTSPEAPPANPQHAPN